MLEKLEKLMIKLAFNNKVNLETLKTKFEDDITKLENRIECNKEYIDLLENKINYSQISKFMPK